ncbi:MAG TPA: hypothetical protein VE958_08085 [Bryobacteraceae bacterium]|nr:hypothetical protein [Bryobacteraceae bacterium]
MTTLGPATGVLDAETIKRLSSDKLKATIARLIDQEIEPESIERYRKARRNVFYWNGIFDLVPRRLNDQVVDYTSVGIPISSDTQRGRELNYNFNIIRGDFIKAVASIGFKAPDCAAVPDEADSEDQIELAQRADLVDQKLTRGIDMNGLQAQLIYDLSLTSTCFIYTPWVADGLKYGFTEEPTFEAENVPFGDQGFPGVTLPKEGEPKKYENGGVEFRILTIFNASAPGFSKDLNNRTAWFRYEDDITEAEAIELFPDITKEVLSKAYPNDQSGIGQMTRQQVSSESGIQRERSNKVRKTLYWLPRMFFNNLREEMVDSGDGQEQKLSEILRTRYTRGLRVTMINGEIMDFLEEAIEDCLTPCKPTVSDYLFCDPLCHDTIPVQELLNRTGNIGVATLLRGVPVTAVESDMFDREALQKREPHSAEFLPVKRRTGQRLEDSFAQLPQARFSDQQMPFMQGMREMSRENNGITLELAGAGPSVSTAHEAEIRKQAAAMQLRLTYNNTRWAVAKAREKAVRQYARYAPGQMKSEPGKGVLGPTPGKMVEIADLVDGKFHFEPDDSMPRTFEDEQRSFKEMVTGNTMIPEDLQSAIGLQSAVNLPRIQKYFGAAGWYYPGKDEVRKVHKIVQQLLGEAPAQQPDGSMAASVPLDPWDDASMISQLTSAWLNSDAGQEQAQSNQGGFQNVVAYWQAADTAANAPQPNGKLSVTANVDKMAQVLGPEAAVDTLGQFGVTIQPPPPQPAMPPMGTPPPPEAPQPPPN